MYGIHQNTVFDPRREVRLWEGDGGLIGFAWLEEMLDWAARRTRVVRGEKAGDELWTRIPEDDPRLDEVIRDLGARSALVTAVHGNEAAIRLYESVGFRTANREWLYGKRP